jgi:hypothetical protein
MAVNAPDDKAVWVGRVLGVTLPASQPDGTPPGGAAPGMDGPAQVREAAATSLSHQRGAEAALLARGSVGRAKLQLAVREAHAEAVRNLNDLCAKVLALPEVKAENRAAEVQQAVQRLAGLIPPLDSALSDAVARYDAAADATERNAVARDATALLAGLQQKLSASRALRQLEQFASADLGGMKVAQDLRGALTNAASELRGAA